jgi:ferric-dicitrate binding protein FerR (iron transport regulator)
MHRLEGTDAFLWRDNMIYFANESLADIADKLERQFSISIRIDKPTLGESRFTGRFRLSDGPSEILRILSLTHPFAIAYGDTPNTIILE